jgi:hypothetical protein
MSSKRGKKITTTTRSSQPVQPKVEMTAAELPSSTSTSTAAASSSSSVQTSRSKSRLSLTRLDEQRTLASLNDRLAGYIDNYQKLENEIIHLTKQLAKAEEDKQESIARLKNNYEPELASCRQTIDETTKERTRLAMENKNLAKALTITTEKLEKKTKESSATNTRLNQIDAKFQDITAQCNKLTSERECMNRQFKDLQDEMRLVQKENDCLRKQAEGEFLKRINLESQLQTKIEDFTFKNNCLLKEIEEMRLGVPENSEQDDVRLQKEIDVQLKKRVDEIRVQYEESKRKAQEELECLYENKIQELEANVRRLQSSSQSKSEEVTIFSARCEQLTQDNIDLQSQRDKLYNDKRELQNQINTDHDRFMKFLTERDEEIDLLVTEKNFILAENEKLRGSQTEVDNELAVMDQLITSVEQSFSLGNIGDISTVAGRSPPVKRPRQDFDSSVEGSVDSSVGDEKLDKLKEKGQLVNAQIRRSLSPQAKAGCPIM